MPTPHIESNINDIAKTVIMPGDPLRAKKIAEKYLTDYKLINSVRNMLGYTGYYKGTRVTIFGSGMGMPSAGIYYYELFKFYDVDNIIRIGSCGSLKEDIKLLDIVIADKAYTQSNYAYLFSKENINIEKANPDLTNKLILCAKAKNINVNIGTISTTDVFDSYVDYEEIYKRIPKKLNILVNEMETFALFHIAKKLNKKAASVLTVVDSKYDEEKISSFDRENSLNRMVEIVLDTIE